LGRLAVGAKISFESVTLEFAHQARRKYLKEIAEIPGKVRPLPRTNSELGADLNGQDLVGVIKT
jgi:hypothetical protein